MLRAMEDTIACLLRIQREHGVADQLSLMNFVVSDGTSVVATRFVWPEGSAASSLYYAEASGFHRIDELAEGAGESPAGCRPPDEMEAEASVRACVRGSQWGSVGYGS